MHGEDVSLVIRHSLSANRQLRTTVQATKYGPIAVFDAGNLTHIAHAASGVVLLSVPNRAAAAVASESLLRLVSDWAHGYDGKRAVFSPSLVHAVAIVGRG